MNTKLKVTGLYLKFLNELKGKSIEESGQILIKKTDLVDAFEAALRPEVDKFNQKIETAKEEFNRMVDEKDEIINNLKRQIK